MIHLFSFVRRKCSDTFLSTVPFERFFLHVISDREISGIIIIMRSWLNTYSSNTCMIQYTLLYFILCCILLYYLFSQTSVRGSARRSQLWTWFSFKIYYLPILPDIIHTYICFLGALSTYIYIYLNIKLYLSVNCVRDISRVALLVSTFANSRFDWTLNFFNVYVSSLRYT